MHSTKTLLYPWLVIDYELVYALIQQRRYNLNLLLTARFMSLSFWFVRIMQLNRNIKRKDLTPAGSLEF